MGTCSGKPKTAEFEEAENHDEVEKKSLDDEKLKEGHEVHFNGDYTAQKIIPECSPQNLPPLQNSHGNATDALLKSESGLEFSLETRINETYGAKYDHLAFGKPQIMPSSEKDIESDHNNSSFEKERVDIKTRKNQVSLATGVTGDPAGAACTDTEGGGSQIQDKPMALNNAFLSTSEVRESVTIITESCARRQSLPNDCPVELVKLDKGSRTEECQPMNCSSSIVQSTATQNQMHPQKDSSPSSMSNVKQGLLQNSVEPSPAATVENIGLLRDAERCSDSSAGEREVNSYRLPHGSEPDMIVANTLVVSKKEDSFLDSVHDMSNGSEADRITENNANTVIVSKREDSSPDSTHDLTVTKECSSVKPIEFSSVTQESKAKLKKFAFLQEDSRSKQLVETSEDHLLGHDKCHAASRSSRTLQGLLLIEPAKPICHKPDIVADIDQMLEKLASEFERQESLSSFSM